MESPFGREHLISKELSRHAVFATQQLTHWGKVDIQQNADEVTVYTAANAEMNHNGKKQMNN